jgi:sugar phosphate isomerase/epimerase
VNGTVNEPSDIDTVYRLRGAERPDVDVYLREVAAHGVRRVFVGAGHVNGLGPDGKVSLSDLRAAMADTGVSLYTVHGLFNGGHNLGETDAESRARAVEAHAATMLAAAELDASNVVVHLGGQGTGETLDACRRSLDRLLPIAEAEGIQLALENLPPGFLGGQVEDISTLLTEFTHPRLGLCLDTGHAHLTAGCSAWLDALGDRLVCLHLHDNDGHSDAHLPPGHGTINWGALSRQLLARGYPGPLVSEARTPAGWTPLDLMAHFQRFFTPLGW